MTREEAKREIDFLDYYLQNHTNDYGEESHTAMMMAIQALEQEPKTGYWEEWKNYLNLPSAIAYSCSKCSAFVHEKTNFCPDCGARMIKKVRKYE